MKWNRANFQFKKTQFYPGPVPRKDDPSLMPKEQVDTVPALCQKER